MLGTLIIFFLGVLPLLLLLGAIAGMCQGSQHTPMTYDEEMMWLMKDHGFSEEEAEDIANY